MSPGDIGVAADIPDDRFIRSRYVEIRSQSSSESVPACSFYTSLLELRRDNSSREVLQVQ